MRGSRVTRIVLLVAALHVAVLSLVFGPRYMGCTLAAALSATLIWGGLLLLSERKRQAGLVAGLVVGLAVQQVAYRVWKAQLPGFWWPLAQFWAVQFLVVYVASHTAVFRRASFKPKTKRRRSTTRSAMSKDGPRDLLVNVFESTHRHFPNFLDRRPICARRALEECWIRHR